MDFLTSIFSLIGGFVRWIVVYKCKRNKLKEILLKETQSDILIGIGILFGVALIIILIQIYK